MDLGHLGCQEGGRRRTQTRNDTKKTAQGSEMGSLLGCFWKLERDFAACVFMCFPALLFIACCGVWDDLGGVLRGIWRAVDLGKSCQSVQLYAFSGFGPFWCGVRFGICFWKGSGMHFVRFWCRLGHPLGLHWLLWPAFAGPVFGGGFGRAKRSKSFQKQVGPAAEAGPVSLL